MGTHILVPLSRPRDIERIVPLLQDVIYRGGVEHVTLVRVVPLAPAAVADYALEYADVAAADEERREEARRLLRSVAARIAWGAVKHDVVALLGSEAETLARFVADGRFDSVLVVSRHRSWLGRLISRNPVARFLDALRLPVLVLPGREGDAHPS